MRENTKGAIVMIEKGRIHRRNTPGILAINTAVLVTPCGATNSLDVDRMASARGVS